MKVQPRLIVAILTISSCLVSCQEEEKSSTNAASKEPAPVITRADLAKHFGPFRLQVMVTGDARQEDANKLANALVKEVGIQTTDKPEARVLAILITLHLSSFSASYSCDVAVLGNTIVDVESQPKTYYTYLWSRGDRGHSEGGNAQPVIQTKMAGALKALLVELKQAMDP